MYSFQHKFCKDCLVEERNFGSLLPWWRRWYSDALRAGRSGDHIPLSSSFPVPTQNGPRSARPPAKGLSGLSPGLKSLGRGDDHQPNSSAEGMNVLELYLRFPSVPAQACHGVTTFPFVV